MTIQFAAHPPIKLDCRTVIDFGHGISRARCVLIFPIGTCRAYRILLTSLRKRLHIDCPSLQVSLRLWLRIREIDFKFINERHARGLMIVKNFPSYEGQWRENKRVTLAWNRHCFCGSVTLYTIISQRCNKARLARNRWNFKMLTNARARAHVLVNISHASQERARQLKRSRRS